MGNIIENVVKCESLYGVVALAILFLGLSVLGLITHKTIQLVLPYIYKIVYEYCNTAKKYKDIHTKANVKDVSIETDLHR